MEEHETEEAPTSFPLFNFAALKKSFKDTPIETATTKADLQFSTDSLLKPPNDSELFAFEKKTRSRGSKTKRKQKDDNELTIKDILENAQAGIPMESDVSLLTQS